MNGNVIDVNDGNTFVQICPTDAEIEIEGAEEPVQETTPTPTPSTKTRR